MASSIEVREPILDHRLIEMSFRTAVSARIGGGHQRMFMKAAAEELLPTSILQQPKQTIVDPQRTWLRTELRDWAYQVLQRHSTSGLNIFDDKNILDEFRRYEQDPNPRTSFHLFQFINVITWFETFFDGS